MIQRTMDCVVLVDNRLDSIIMFRLQEGLVLSNRYLDTRRRGSSAGKDSSAGEGVWIWYIEDLVLCRNW